MARGPGSHSPFATDRRAGRQVGISARQLSGLLVPIVLPMSSAPSGLNRCPIAAPQPMLAPAMSAHSQTPCGQAPALEPAKPPLHTAAAWLRSLVATLEPTLVIPPALSRITRGHRRRMTEMAMGAVGQMRDKGKLR